MAETFDNHLNSKKYFLSGAAIFAVIISMVGLLRWQGRIWWCKLGDYAPWTIDA
jgi:hypothetical protein